jgi:hypothetical protein
MAINFLNNVDLNQNQLIKAAIESQVNNTAAGTGVEGQLYFDTTLDVLKVWAGGAWTSVGGGVETLVANSTTFVNLLDSGTAADPILTASLSATGTPGATTYLRGDNSWAALPAAYTWSIQGDTGGPLTVASGTTIDIAGGTNVTTARSGNTITINSTDQFVGTVTSVSATTAGDALDVAVTSATTTPALAFTWAGTGAQYIDGTGDLVTFPAIPQGDVTGVNGGTYITVTNPSGPVPTVNHDSTSRTDTTSATSPGYGGTFTAVDSVTSNSTGHVTALNLKTITLPAADDTNTTYTLPTSAGAANTAVVTLTPGGSGGGGGSVTFSGTDDEIRVSETTGANGTVIVGLPADVTITSDLTVGDNVTLTGGNLSVTGTGSFTGQVTVPTANTGTSAPNLAQVELLIAGVGIFQGSYDAATNTPALEGASNIALNTGDYFVVSVAGTFLGEALEPGDFIFANNDIAAGTSPALSNYTVVQADDNVAGAGASDGATQKGVSGFDSDHFTVSSNGWVQLKPQSNANAARVVLNSALSYVTRVEAGGLTTFTVSVSDASLFGAGAVGQNTKAEVTENSGDYETVYAGVSRSGGSIVFEFKGSVANSAYATLLSYV